MKNEGALVRQAMMSSSNAKAHLHVGEFNLPRVLFDGVYVRG